ncbi:hypothetical protein Tcan_17824 [Toxocara canis]|uniref:Transmembrane protein n=1 Tax=Toxocara canis TaxID=6265 RepID=A0A0B2VYP9_TOXCA|nr:hypothetical protein Tcan_17824 [Toxocara canis]
MDAITRTINVLEPAYDSPTKFAKLLIVNASLNSTNRIWQRYEETGSLFDPSLIFTHFTTQVPAFVGFCIIGAICIAIAVSSITIAIARFGCGRCGAKRYQPHPTSRCRFALLFFLFAFCWIVMLTSLLVFAFGSIDLCTYRTENAHGVNHSLHSPMMNETRNLFKREAPFARNLASMEDITVQSAESDRQEHVIGLLSDSAGIHDRIRNVNNESVDGELTDLNAETTTQLIAADDSTNQTATIMYNSENAVSDTGSDMRNIMYTNLHTEGVYAFTFAMLVVVATPMILLLIISIFTVLTGTICYLRSYHPMDRSNTSNRMGLWTIRLCSFLLVVAPLLLLLADFAFAYAEVHSQLCPTLQENIQLKAFEQKLDNFGGTIDEAEVLAILSDLRSPERTTFNERECDLHSRSAHALWISEFLLGFFGFICAVTLLCMSKFFLRMKTEYYWNSSDNYSTLSDVRPDCTKIVTVSSAF